MLKAEKEEYRQELHTAAAAAAQRRSMYSRTFCEEDAVFEGGEHIRGSKKSDKDGQVPTTEAAGRSAGRYRRPRIVIINCESHELPERVTADAFSSR